MIISLFRVFLLFQVVFLLNTQITLADEVDIASGQEIFNENCTACHAGGQNTVQPDKTLEKDVLAKNSMNSIEAIVKQVTNGKNAMPAFGGRLSEEEIESVATYVLKQSDIGW
uniref:Cytochrome c6 n=1 Tax=Dasya binghamiae TaxID=1896963 RepID=A0A1C8XRX5_9FLOR|nr:cytochrome c553 [Dasya binghamiae]AOH77223.1 cytochrome c553 [Dasya binghamiae]